MTETLRKGTVLYYKDKHKRNLCIESITVDSVGEDGFTFFFDGKKHELGFDAINSRLFFLRSLGKIGFQTIITKSPEEVIEKKTESPNVPHDITISCAECGRTFVWTIEVQEFYHKKGFSPPRTCSIECREQRKKARERTRQDKELGGLMQPSGPYRTGAAGRSTVNVSGGNPQEISDWTMENIEKGYTHKF